MAPGGLLLLAEVIHSFLRFGFLLKRSLLAWELSEFHLGFKTEQWKGRKVFDQSSVPRAE